MSGIEKENKIGFKIALIEPVGGHGGMNYYDLGLSQGLASNDCQVNWYTCDKTSEKNTNQITIFKFFNQIYNKKYPSVLRGMFFVFGLLVSLIHAKVTRCKLVHYHFFHYGALEWLMASLAKLFLFKVVITVHDVESFIEGDKSKYIKGIFSGASFLITHNRHSNDALLNKLNELGVEPPASQIIPHGNYLPFIKKRASIDSKKALNLPSDKKIILFFGQIKSVKGLDLLLEALSELKDLNCVLVIAGKVWKDDWALYQKIIEKNNLEPMVLTEIRYIDDSEVDNFFSAADLIVLPYRKIYQSGVLLMAMSYGLVSLVSNIPGMTEIIKDKVNGFVFKTGSVSDLSDKLRVSLTYGDIESIEKQVLYDITHKFDWNVIGKKTFELYKQCIS